MDGATVSLIISGTSPLKTYQEGRVCSHDGCTTVLSRYNPDPYCGAHTPAKDWLRYCGYSFKPCAGCGELIKAGTKGNLCRPCCTDAQVAGPLARRCRHCGRTFPETHEHFNYVKPWHIPVGTCKACERSGGHRQRTKNEG